MSYKEQALAMLNDLYNEIDNNRGRWNIKPTKYVAGQAILAADPQLQVAIICTSLCQPVGSKDRSYEHIKCCLRDLYNLLAKRNLLYTLEDTQRILKALARGEHHYYVPSHVLLRGLLHSLADASTLTACRPILEKLRETANSWHACTDKHKSLRLIDDILDGQLGQNAHIKLDHWGKQILTCLEEMEPEMRERWLVLVHHCDTARGTTPTNTWSTQARQLLTELGQEAFVRVASEWIAVFAKKDDERPDEDNADLLKGLVWCCCESESVSLAAVLADAAIEGYRKLPSVGPRSAKIAGACVYALKQMPGLQAAAQLERVRLNVKQASFLKGIESALAEAAHRADMSREDLEELTVPTYNLREGCLRVPVGDAVAEIVIVGLDVQVHWYDAAGKPRKTVPAEVKREHKQELKDLKRLSDDLEHMLIAQRMRIELLPRTERVWLLPNWRERYLDHALVGLVARRLIWRFSTGEHVVDGIWLDGQLVDANDLPVEGLSDTTVVSSWHPILCDIDEVRAWRDWFEHHQVTQPFKQAHREIYLLTDAERNTRVYSNRFAAHILRQHQFNALARARGWRNQLHLLMDDSHTPASLDLPHWGLRAEFWIEGAGEDYGTDTNETGTYLYLSTDQVRFYTPGTPENYADAGGSGYWSGYGGANPIPLEHIPPLVLSEVLRDVDLFVGVASVGNDPTWQDGGPQGPYRDYWHSYSFGELSATAKTRKQLLEHLLPRLAIAERCALEGRFLRVQGDLRTYKIHLGSGNILMEPNDQYLCIVPGRGSDLVPGEKVFLPFEGDNMFSIILSKAFLLAEDTKIADPAITRQIGKKKITTS